VRVQRCGNGHGMPLLLLHGWGCSVYAWRYLLKPLAARGYRVFAVDLQGHGSSDKPAAAEQYTLSSLTAHALEIIDALGLQRLELLGHSMGGRIACQMALDAPQRVVRLWLINPVGFGPMPHITAARPFAGNLVARALPTPLPRWLVRIPVSAVYGRIGKPTARDVEGYREPTRDRGFIVASAHLLRRFDWREVSPPDFETLRQKSWVVLGALDRVVQAVRSGADRKWREAGWRVHVVQGSAHVVHEESPSEVMATMENP
jgi:pimeloyl-ACP methyl ester carboxylesterase